MHKCEAGCNDTQETQPAKELIEAATRVSQVGEAKPKRESDDRNQDHQLREFDVLAGVITLRHVDYESESGAHANEQHEQADNRRVPANKSQQRAPPRSSIFENSPIHIISSYKSYRVNMHDRIILHNCLFTTTIGINKEERRTKRALHLDIELFTDIREAAAADQIDATVSYTDVHSVIRDLIESKSWDLIEAVAESTADIILKKFPLAGVFVRVRKPSALHDRNVEYTAVEITRTK